MPLRSRKNARLVCKYWYSVCNCILFLRTEKFIFSNLYPSCKILDTIRNSKFNYFNLEFHCVMFKNYKCSFWKECGYKIYSLSFINCELSKSTFIDVVTCCTNLQNLSLVYENLLGAKLSVLIDALADLLQKKKKRESRKFGNTYSSKVVIKLYFIILFYLVSKNKEFSNFLPFA